MARIVIACDSFKECLSSQEVCAALAAGVARARPDATIDECPLADGGEGTVDAMVAAAGGDRRTTRVRGPLGKPVDATWGLLPPATAVIEMAAAAGLHLVPTDQRDPTRTTTFGVGELIRAALDAGAEQILIGLGGSSTTDGGTGCAQALGVRFLDEARHLLPNGLAGGRLDRVATIEASRRDPRLHACAIEVACDVDNPLTGPRGAAAVYGPQKGAAPAQVALLDRNLSHLAALIRRDLALDVDRTPGAGAAGGLGAGLIAFCGATLRSGIELVTDAVGLRRRLRGAELVITGEGRIDAQSMMGKVVAGVGRLACEAGVPCLAICGARGEGAEACQAVLESYHAIADDAPDPGESFRNARHLLARAAERIMRRRRAQADGTAGLCSDS